MPASFTSDPQKGAGFGIITVPQITCTNAPTFALYRASDGLCLKPQGVWQSSEVYLNPDAWDNDANSLRMSVDASIVDNLDELDTYRLLIKDGANAPIAQSLVIENIIYSPLYGGQGISSVDTPSPAPKPVPEPNKEVQVVRVTESEPKPIPEPEPVSKTKPAPVAEELARQSFDVKGCLISIAVIIGVFLLLVVLGIVIDRITHL